GMGVVYRAQDVVLRRTVAVKVLPAELAEVQPAHVARFEREARAAASLAHPRIVAVFDTGIDEGTRFIAMECVSGASLAAILAERAPLDPARAAKIGEQVADALAAAHAAGLIHRDIKPANVMLAEDGSVKVLDFGIARAQGHTTLTQEQSVLGSAAYMAPEQARGERADERSDIYSLGCLLYAILTGRPPFGGDSAAAVLHQHLSADPRPPHETNGAVPAALEALVLAMLAKSPASRPQSAAQVRDELAALARPATGLVGRARPIAAPAVRRTARLRAPTAVTRVLGATGTAGATAVTRAIGAIPPRSRRPAALAALAGCVLLVALILLLAGGGSTPRARTRAQHGSTAPRRAARSSSTGVPKTTSTGSGPSSAAATASPPSVGAAAGALTALIAQDVQAGTIAQRAAQQITTHLGDVLGSFESGNAADAQRRLADLARLAGMLASREEVTPPAAAPLNAALSTLGAALSRSAPAADAPAPVPAATPPGHADKPKGHGGKHGGGGD
ncbi:MAG TPA: protein kinase, partial [Solirubrobacteraceae bacterium]|nr:protein kinase [Solirubrobacteraceae bacterium]